MKIQLQTILCLLLFSFGEWASAAKISGRIQSNGEGISEVSVQIESLKQVTNTDSLGNFEFKDIKAGKYILKFRKTGFANEDKHVTLDLQQNLFLNITMTAFLTDFKALRFTTTKQNPSNVINGIDLLLRPVASSQDLLRLVPGLFIAQHAGGGKAEQIFLRGFDVDHGTDFAIYVDGIPVNMPSHAHGQGYADLHFLIPETVKELEVNKGPHNTKYGDLATAGSGEFKTFNTLAKNMLKLEYGMFDSRRALLMLNLLEKKHLLASKHEDLYLAAEYKFTNSFFNQKQDFYRLNFFTKYTAQLLNGDRLEISASNFNSSWNASGQIPDRKVADGSISRYGSIDPTEGGKTSRSNFNIIHQKTLSNGTLKSQAFYSRYDFNLYSNFTFYLKDSVNGDQIFQGDHRDVTGLNSVRSIRGKFFNKELLSNLGSGMRYDHASIQLNHTVKRQFLDSKVNGILNQTQYWIYIDEALQINNKLKLNAGLRADAYNFGFKNNTYDSASGNAKKGILSPKLNWIYTASSKVQIFLKSGYGFHSNDARAVILGKLENTLAKAFGNEIGSTFKPLKNMLVNAAFWSLDLQSELVYVGDEGIVEAIGRSRRIGLDLSVRYQLSKFIYIDADVNYNHGRLRDEAKGNNLIPLAPVITSIGGIAYKHPSGLGCSIRYRYMGNRAAIEDNSIRAQGYFLSDAVMNYQFKNFQFGLSAENIFNTEWKEAQFATLSKLKEETKAINEIHFTPGSPRFLKFQIAITF